MLARWPLHLNSFLFFPYLAAQPEPFDFVGDALMILFFCRRIKYFWASALVVSRVGAMTPSPVAPLLGNLGNHPSHHLQRTEDGPFSATHAIHTMRFILEGIPPIWFEPMRTSG